jgi:choline dehydrogenase-like flavoprotein
MFLYLIHIIVEFFFRVKGIKRLRVADGSVMRSETSGNTNVPIMMIGEKAADLISVS